MRNEDGPCYEGMLYKSVRDAIWDGVEGVCHVLAGLICQILMTGLLFVGVCPVSFNQDIL